MQCGNIISTGNVKVIAMNKNFFIRLVCLVTMAVHLFDWYH